MEMLCWEMVKLVLEKLPLPHTDYLKLVQDHAVRVLEEIVTVVRTPDLNDFEVVEEIVRILEKHNISAGSCHDF